MLPALQAQQLSPKCRPKATLRSEHNTCQYCLALRGTKWCDGQLTGTCLPTTHPQRVQTFRRSTGLS